MTGFRKKFHVVNDGNPGLRSLCGQDVVEDEFGSYLFYELSTAKRIRDWSSVCPMCEALARGRVN